jgi:hypothetical protein
MIVKKMMMMMVFCVNCNYPHISCCEIIVKDAEKDNSYISLMVITTMTVTVDDNL